MPVQKKSQKAQLEESLGFVPSESEVKDLIQESQPKLLASSRKQFTPTVAMNIRIPHEYRDLLEQFIEDETTEFSRPKLQGIIVALIKSLLKTKGYLDASGQKIQRKVG